ncbi:MAG: polyhydroxyalkanoate biosynthesis repressor PhaR [Rickettsiales bacterium]|nr:polyhydroxyalkanoate biosynthesis repressor PhaR [Rickettsiales bacterium]|tara:strand:+ start:122 stop:1156 length:1035 start_codon:yes stop_codon:yes gene_type:complete
MKFKINNLELKRNCKPIIIAEIGINHEGSLKLAKKMAKIAINSGAHIIKHQTHIVDDEMSSHAKDWKIDYIGKSIYELMEDCALSKDDEINLKKFVEEKGATYISTPFSRAAANFLYEINVPAFKIGSGECNNYPLIEHICKFKKPIILSTGMNSILDVKKSVAILKKNKIQFALMHTTNSYPTNDSDVRLGAMLELINNFKGIPVGLSDHTIGNLASFSALALGADLIERHFTDYLTRKGPDIKCSMNGKQCLELVEGSKRIFNMRGGKKGIVKSEIEVAKFAFSSVVSIKEIKKGQTFSKDNIWVKRPGTGYYNANDFNSIIGKKSKNNINSGEQIKKNDVE